MKLKKNIIKIILTAAIILVCAINFTGCKEKDKDYTIDAPYNFNNTENNPTAAPDVSSENNKDDNKPTENSTASTPIIDNKDNTSASKPTAGSSDDIQNNNGNANVDNDGPVEAPTFLEQAESYKIPQKTTEKMTTDALMRTYMSYPIIKDLCFEESPVDTYNTWIKSSASCGQELMNRKDVVSVIISYYKNELDTESKKHLESDEEIYKEFGIDWIELLLCQDTVKNKATAKEKSEIFKLAQKRDSNVETNGYAVTDMLPDLADMYK